MVRAAFKAATLSRSFPTVAGVESMPDDAPRDDRKQPPTDEAALSARFQRLGERLGKFNRGRPSGSPSGEPPASDPSAIARGFRLSAELVAGVLVGAGIGWLLDRWLGITPWGMIVFLLLGFAAGVLNVMRVAGVIQPNRLGPPDRK
jgi:ATP synthase protein I